MSSTLFQEWGKSLSQLVRVSPFNQGGALSLILYYSLSMYTATDSNRQTENFKSIDYRLTAKEESMKFYYYSELNRQKSNEAQKVVYLV